MTIEYMKIEEMIKHLKDNKVIAIETDTILGLSTIIAREAVSYLQHIKHRNKPQGILMIAKYVEHFLPYMDFSIITDEQFQRLYEYNDKPTTFIVPARQDVEQIQGIQVDNTIAIRLVDKYPINEITEMINAPLTSTSANITGKPVATNNKVLFNYFGTSVIYTGSISCKKTAVPSRIINLVTGEILRHA